MTPETKGKLVELKNSINTELAKLSRIAANENLDLSVNLDYDSVSNMGGQELKFYHIEITRKEKL